MKPGKKRVYGARVKDRTGRRHDGNWFRIRTRANRAGLWGTRKQAEQVLERVVANDPDLVAGSTFDQLVDKPVRWQDWLTGDVVPPSAVPSRYRDDYIDTLERTARAAREYGHPIYVSDSFRPRALQEQRWQEYLNGGPLAARPGTSDHERGLSLDIPNARSTPKLIKALRKQRMIDDVASEQWHVTNMARKG